MERISKMWRSALAMVLAICMVLSFCPVAAFAVDADDDVMNYVSFGASNVNGYGLSGYLPDDVTAMNKDEANVYGYQRMPVGSYPYLIAEELNKTLGGTTSAYNGNLKQTQPFTKVHVDQLAMSSMRVEELRFLLDESYPGDSYTAWRFYGPGSQNWFGKAEGDLATLRTVYQNAIKEADVITLDMGINNFGVYVSHQLGNKYGETLEDIDPALAAKFNAAKAQVKQLAAQFSPNAVAMLNQMDGMIDTLAYALAGFCVSFDVVIEKIRELNPDATVVVVSIQNLLTGLSVELDGFDGALPLDKIFGAVINAANLYTASGSPYSDSYLYADVRKGGRVEFFVDQLLSYDGNPASLTQDMIDCFTVYDDDLDVIKNITSMVDGYLAGELKSALNPYISPYLVGIYGPSDEKVILQKFLEDGKNSFATAAPILAGHGVAGETCLDAMKDAYNMYAATRPVLVDKALTLAYDVLAELFQAGVIDHTINFSALASANKGAIEDSLLDEIATAVSTAITGLASDPDYEFTLSDVYPGGFYEAVAAGAGEPVSVVKSIACMGIRTGIGNSFYGHPNRTGHKQIKNSVWATMKDTITGKDVVTEEVNLVLGELKNFLEKYGPEAADQAYKLWVDKGYQALVDQYITELTTNVTDRYTNYTEVVLPAINSALDALNAQKITLTTELATLKTQLLAKKAELEKVLAEQEITDITPPEFDIDTELGNNEQTQVPENDCAGVGSVADELAAAIADLEHAIAVIEALIADVTADIEDLVALATEIAEGVATLEQTLTDVAAAAQDLKNAVDAVVTVLTDDSAKAASKTFMKAFNAARDAALVAVDTVELLVKTANEDVATIEASVATLKEGMNALVNKLCTDWENADKEALLQKIINKLPTSAQVIVGGSVLLVQQTLEENQAAIINKLNAEKDALKVKLDADKEVVLKELAEKKAALEAEYGPQIAAAQAKIDALNAQIDTEIQTKYAELQVAAQAKIDALTLEAQAKIAALDAELQGYVAQLAGDITDEVRETIQAQIDRINNDIAAVNADLACAIEHVDAELKAAYDALVEEVTNAYNDVMTELQNAYNALVDAFETAIKELQDAADNAIQGLIDAYEAAIKALQDAADKAIQELIDAAKKELEKLGEIGEILSELMDSVLAAIHGDVAKAQAAINEILHGALDSVNDLADALVDVGIDTVNTIVDEVTKVINDMLHEATHADLELGAESLYIALGDGTAAPESYVEKLAAQLEAEYGVEDYTNYAQAGNTAGAEVAKVADRAGIADADLITIGFGNATIIETAIRNADSVEYDWAGLVGADLVPYVEDALADVYAEIANADMSEDMAEFVNSIVEGLAYGAVEYAVELPALIAAIREVNADAVIVIVGQYNPLEDVVLEMGGSTLDLSEYIGYFVDAVAVHGIGYAMITGDAIFVEAPEVDTNNTDTSWSEIDLFKMLMNQKGFEVLNPSESGDTYITNQILGALNITKIEEEPAGLWGDANDNGKVNLQDAIMILKAANGHDIAINRKLSDVTGEGQVKLNDAILVLQRANGSTALFPVEK